MVVVVGKGLPRGNRWDSASPAEVTLVEKTLATIRVPHGSRPGRPRQEPEWPSRATNRPKTKRRWPPRCAPWPRMPTYIILKDVKKRWGKGQEDIFPVTQFEKLWGTPKP